MWRWCYCRHRRATFGGCVHCKGLDKTGSLRSLRDFLLYLGGAGKPLLYSQVKPKKRERRTALPSAEGERNKPWYRGKMEAGKNIISQVLKEVYTQMAKHISVSCGGCLLRNISLRHLCLDRDLSPMNWLFLYVYLKNV